MPVLRKILPFFLIVALLYGALLLAERLTTQELTRVSHPVTQQAVALMWKPRLLRGDGVCFLDLVNSEGKVVDTVRLGIRGAAFEALQQFGGLGFQGEDIAVSNLGTGDLVQQFVVRDGRLSPAE